MTAPLRQLIVELRQGAEMSPEGASAVAWRQKIKGLPQLSVQAHGPGLFVIGHSARNLLLQRGQVRAESDQALRGVLIELANILEVEAQAIAGSKNRQASRREVPYHMKGDA